MATRYNLISPRPGKEGKTNWHKVGVAFPRDKGGFSLVFDSLPLPDAEGRVSLLMTEPLPDDGVRAPSGNRQKQEEPRGGRPDMDDEIPF